MKNLSQIISDFLEQQNMPKDAGILLAVSGGVDSLLLAELFVQSGIKPAIAHCNFKLRGVDADQDQRFVKDYAQKHGLRFFTTNFDTKKYSTDHGISIQMAARELRYNYFRALMDEHNLDYLATAHHADDSLETILLNLGRGTGLQGLSGISPNRNMVLRPLLPFSKNEIESMARSLDLQWREDASNAKTDYQRNYIRHKVLPVFKENFPGFEKSFDKTQRQLQDESELFSHLIQEKIAELEVVEHQTRKLPIAEVSNTPGVQSLLHFWLQPYGEFDLTSIINCLQRESGKVFENGRYQLLVDRDFLILQKCKEVKDESFHIEETTEEIKTPLSILFESLPIENHELIRDKSIAMLDKDKLTFPLTLRRWKAGDNFIPLGMKGKKKLSDFFIDQKVNRFEKDNSWVLTSGNDIVWVINHRIDDRFKISDDTKTVYFARLI